MQRGKERCGDGVDVLIFGFWGWRFMVLKKWEDLPDFMKTEEVKPYYEALKKKRLSLFFKRAVSTFSN